MLFSSKAVESIAVRKDVPDSTTAVVPGQRPVRSILYHGSCYGGPSKRRQNRNKRISMRPDLRQVKWIEPREKGSFFSNVFHKVVDSIFSPYVVSLPDPIVPQVDDIKKKLLVLDMDETLLHSVTDEEEEEMPYAPDHHVVSPEYDTSLPIFLRPGVHEFLKTVASEYEIIVWTAGTRSYAEPILDWLDPNGYITTRLYRDSCTEQEDGSFLKDLSTLNRALSEVIIVDNNPDSFVSHPENGIKCVDFYFDKCDEELKMIGTFLHMIKDEKDVREIVPKFEEWIDKDYLKLLDEQVDCCSDDFEACDTCNDFEVSVPDSIAEEELGSLFYIDEKGRQRRRSHRLLSKK